jgi:hypothetical protein
VNGLQMAVLLLLTLVSQDATLAFLKTAAAI